ncbi:hypothetical protein RA086_13240 [Lactiplantibacillus sp. WILCCON 0030]|uniref:Neutral/alkaline non-lysosomal ceramidase N-terminal domain-containing protein n=1 Tax=Lactiplantibacillus brownii TaxID=3069269 RepID=A0ABU1AC65_9LACO|nr:hypothetical protein [Lactiplantibacillus brownii]MDQ7938573.1 hypothetical protein [Lactiplantibacillus brownii]
MKTIQVGFGKAVIDFKPTDFPIREFAKQLDTLNSRIMLIAGPQPFVLVSLDLTSLPNHRVIELFKDKVAATLSVAPANIWITVTHTFAAPHLPSNPQTAAAHQIYDFILAKLMASLVMSCQAAQQDLQPVKLGHAVVDCPLNVNRNVATPAGWWLGRNFAGYSNHQLRVWAFQKADGQRHLLVNYDLQPSVLDHLTDDADQRMISSDLVGFGLKKYETDQQVAIFLPGAAGDQRPLFVGHNDEPFAVAKSLMQRQGDVFYESIQQAVQTITTWTTLSQVQQVAQPMTLPTKVQKLTTFELTPTHQDDFEPTGATVDLSVVGIKLNQLLLIGTQPELNSQFGNKCRHALGTDQTTMVATLVNGAAKYLPEARDFDQVTYQAMNTHLGRGSDQLVLKACTQLGQKLIKEDAAKC